MERLIESPSRPGCTRGRWRLTALLAASAVVLTGCLDGEIDVKVNGDGSGLIVVEVFPTPQVMGVIAGVDIEAALAGSFTGVSGFDFSDVERDGRAGYRLEVLFEDHRDVVPILIEGGSVLGQQVVLFSAFSLTELPDDGWQLSADINPIAQIIPADADGALVTVEELADALQRSGSSTGVELSVSLPGNVVSSNADRTDRGTATWVLDRVDAPPQLRMRTEPTSFPSPLQLLLGGSALVVLLGVVLALVGAGPGRQRNKSDQRRSRRRRKARAKDSASAWGPPQGTSMVAPAAPSAQSLPLPPLTAAPSPAAPATSTSETQRSPGLIPSAPAPDAGWYDDPGETSRSRWWDGQRWTDHFSDPDPD